MSPWNQEIHLLTLNAVGSHGSVFSTIIRNTYLYILPVANFDIEFMSQFVDRIEFIIPAFYCFMNLLDTSFLLRHDIICSCIDIICVNYFGN
jgi:hypothetical protein